MIVIPETPSTRNRLNVIIQHYKFNTFIAMFLIISEIYLFLFRTHVI